MAVTSVPLTAEADDRKYISSISLKVHVELDPGNEIDDGDSIDTSNGGGDGTYVYTSSNKYSIDSAEWATDTTVGVGDTPKIEVYLDPNIPGIQSTGFGAATAQVLSASAEVLLYRRTGKGTSSRWSCESMA